MVWCYMSGPAEVQAWVGRAEEDAVVRCYSGHTYAQEPQSFLWRGQEYQVARLEHVRRVLDSRSGLVTVQFAVVTPERGRFRLSYDEAQETWAVEPA